MAEKRTGGEDNYLELVKNNVDKLMAPDATFDPAYEAYKLKRSGLGWREVAKRTGFNTEGAAVIAVRNYLATAAIKLTKEHKDEMLTMELDRLDTLQQAYWDAAILGDDKAATIVLKIIQQRSRMIGIEEPKSDTTGAQTTILVNGAGMAHALKNMIEHPPEEEK